MGYVEVRLVVIGIRSNHNDSHDKQDQALWDDFKDRLEAMTEEEKYKDIMVTVMEA